VVAENFRSTL